MSGTDEANVKNPAFECGICGERFGYIASFDKHDCGDKAKHLVPPKDYAVKFETRDINSHPCNKDRPAHYKPGPCEPINIIETYNLNFAEGNILKYILRYKEKGGVEDLVKARYYLQRLIERETA